MAIKVKVGRKKNKKTDRSPHTLHLSLSSQLSQWDARTISARDRLRYYFFVSPSSSDFTKVAAPHCSLQGEHKGPGLRSSALLNSFHLELLAFSHLVKPSGPSSHPLLTARKKRHAECQMTDTFHYRSNRLRFPLRDRSDVGACFCFVALHEWGSIERSG